MFCSQCGKQIGDNVKFCGYCGAANDWLKNGQGVQANITGNFWGNSSNADEEKEEIDFDKTLSVWDVRRPVNHKKYYLLISDVDNIGKYFKLQCDSSIKIGRVTGDVIIDYDNYISRLHCEIIRKENSIFVKDCGSANGTFYRGNRLDNQETPINNGDVITIGKTRLSITLAQE